MAAPTTAAGVKKTLANLEPSTHGPLRQLAQSRGMSGLKSEAEVIAFAVDRRL